MLKFYGIRFNQKGIPERFSLSFALKESLNAGLHIIDYYQRDYRKVVKAIDKEIEKLFLGVKEHEKCKKFRFLTAKWFRSKDIVQFLFNNSQTVDLKLKIAGILNSRETIVGKWHLIKPLLLDHISSLDVLHRNEQLGDSESDLNLVLQMISLFFLEQDEEMPPANLELQFIRYQFPRIIWKKKDGFNASSNPFWLPKNLYCRSSYLSAQIISKIYENAENVTDKQTTISIKPEEKEVQLQSQNSVSCQKFMSVSFNSLFPEGRPDRITLEFDDADEKNHQLPLIPENAHETLLSLQKMIQKKFSHEGVKHFLAILRQLAEIKSDVICSFDTIKHLKLVARETKDGKFSSKQHSLMNNVFQLLMSLKVKRCWNEAGQGKQVTNPFLLELGCEGSISSAPGTLRKMLLDPMFLPGMGNPFRLGSHLTLISQKLFRESIYKHALLPGLSSYITGTWLNEFLQKKGTTEKTTREIIEGCAFNVTSANKYQILRKLNSELAYMEQKCYISQYKRKEDKEGNPWNDVHCVTAPDVVMKSIVDKMQAIGANSVSEKLIA